MLNISSQYQELEEILADIVNAILVTKEMIRRIITKHKGAQYFNDNEMVYAPLEGLSYACIRHIRSLREDSRQPAAASLNAWLEDDLEEIRMYLPELCERASSTRH
ncbi:hypothetical protein BGZ76_002585 [Entomortierella beljakovae]|nr:hypothetical protein BGZ76_002585 [Entomortierella beljakovae]